MKFITKILIIPVFLLVGTVFADDYDANYYEDGWSSLFKVRGFYMNSSSKIKDLSQYPEGKSKPSSLAKNGFGLDTSTAIFFTDNIATELALGFSVLKTEKSELSTIASAFGGNNDMGKKHDIFFIPLTSTFQYHIAPFGAIRPYIGGGYHFAYMHTRSKSMKVSNGHGAVLQFGIDFIAKDDSFFTFDVKQYFLKSKVKFKQQLSSTLEHDINSKVTWNPLIASIGFGFKF